MSKVGSENKGDAWTRYLLRLACEKYLVKGKDNYWTFMDLEKAYDRIHRQGLWAMLRLHVLGDRLLMGVEFLYEE